MRDPAEIRVLIVEDNPIIAADLESLIVSEGMKVAAVSHTAVDAFDALSNRSIDLAMLDVHLGSGQTGLDVAEVIDTKYDIPYIFLTSFDDDATLQAAQELSPYGYLVKPFQERTVISMIKMAIGSRDQLQQKDPLDLTKLKEKAITKLSDQETKIVTNLLEGYSYKQISEMHFVTVNTVKYHAKNIYLKLQIKGRAELAALIR